MCQLNDFHSKARPNVRKNEVNNSARKTHNLMIDLLPFMLGVDLTIFSNQSNRFPYSLFENESESRLKCNNIYYFRYPCQPYNVPH